MPHNVLKQSRARRMQHTVLIAVWKHKVSSTPLPKAAHVLAPANRSLTSGLLPGHELHSLHVQRSAYQYDGCNVVAEHGCKVLPTDLPKQYHEDACDVKPKLQVVQQLHRRPAQHSRVRHGSKHQPWPPANTGNFRYCPLLGHMRWGLGEQQCMWPCAALT